MKRGTGDRILLAVLFGIVPLIFIFLVLLPNRNRLEARKARLEAIALRLAALPTIQPLTAQEHAVLEAPAAPWKTRIPLLHGESERLAHYHFVVTGLQSACKRDGVALVGVRASWDGLDGSYSLPADLGNPALGLPPQDTAPAGQLQAWVLDARIGGTPDRLFQAMETLGRVDPLLEPVGLRWESLPDVTRQSLLLRNLILVP